MTTGSITTGPYHHTDKIHYAKAWTGGDGWVVPTRYSSYPMWNPYQMASFKFHSSQPNLVGTHDDNPNGPITVQENHVFLGYSPIRGDGTVSPNFPTSLFSQYWTDREELALLAKLLKKIKGHDADLGVSLAEVDKLAGTVAGTLKNLAYGMLDLSKGRFTQFVRRFGASSPTKDRVEKLRTLDISGRFLEMRYAWTPAINDVYEASKAFEEISNGPRTARTRAGKRKLYEKEPGNTNYCTATVDVEVRRSYIFEQYEEMGFLRQLGLANPATIIWERLPWSFVIDWFIPIGTYLSLIGQVPFLKGRFCRTSSIRTTQSGIFNVGANPPWLAEPYPTAEWEIFYLERSTSETPPAVPTPSFRVAGAIQGKRVANAIALTYQVANKLVGGRDGVDDFAPDVNLGEF
jgi:hypothetical protein